jgi:hypothetical protein
MSHRTNIELHASATQVLLFNVISSLPRLPLSPAMTCPVCAVIWQSVFSQVY